MLVEDPSWCGERRRPGPGCRAADGRWSIGWVSEHGNWRRDGPPTGCFRHCEWYSVFGEHNGQVMLTRYARCCRVRLLKRWFGLVSICSKTQTSGSGQ